MEKTTLLKQFYDAFTKFDAEKMLSCYHKDIEFKDPAFGTLHGKRAGAMWEMLCSRQEGKDFKIIYKDLITDGNKGSLTWEAFYEFGPTKRKVHNIIQADFTFKEGKILIHHDDFNLHSWAKQAMGLKGWLLGNTGFFKRKLHQQTSTLLDSYIKSKS